MAVRVSPRALLLIVVLGLAAGAGWVWRAWPQPRPPADPWPAALEEIGTIVRDAAPHADRGASAARAAAEPMAFVDRTRPLLEFIDEWRKVSIRARERSGAGWLEKLGIPDNVYDGLVAALDVVTPGTAALLHQLEAVARSALEGRDTLLTVAAELDATRQTLQSFEEAPSRQTADALAASRTRFKERVDPLARDLASWHKRISFVANGVRSIRTGVQNTAETRIGSLVKPELSVLDGLLEEMALPLQQYERHQADVVGALSETDARLGRITSIVADARAIEAGMPTERERVEQRRVRQQLIGAWVAGSLVLIVIALVVFANGRTGSNDNVGGDSEDP